jgi:hypothetical protein
MHREPLTLRRDPRRERIPEPDTIGEAAKRVQPDMRHDPLARAFHRHRNRAVTVHPEVPSWSGFLLVSTSAVSLARRAFSRTRADQLTQPREGSGSAPTPHLATKDVRGRGTPCRATRVTVRGTRVTATSPAGWTKLSRPTWVDTSWRPPAPTCCTSHVDDERDEGGSPPDPKRRANPKSLPTFTKSLTHVHTFASIQA